MGKKKWRSAACHASKICYPFGSMGGEIIALKCVEFDPLTDIVDYCCIIVVARRSLWFVEKEPFKIYHFFGVDSQFLVFLLEKELLTNLSTSFSKFWSAPGGWIMLQNIHLMQAWLKDLERALEVIEEFVHDDARHTNRTHSKQIFVVIDSNILFGRTIFFMALRRIHRY